MTLTVAASAEYDRQGRAVSQTDALGNTVFTAYDSLGAAVSRSGATYPAHYSYDTEGRMTSLSTTRDGNTWDTTQWLFDPAIGLASNKVDADGSRIGYTYTPDGKLASGDSFLRFRRQCANQRRLVLHMGLRKPPHGLLN